jgi:hypothetical protein
MIGVILQVMSAAGETRHCLDIAAMPQPALEKAGGFISLERFSRIA